MDPIDQATRVRSDGLHRVTFGANGSGLFSYSESRWIVFDNPAIDPSWNAGEPSGLYASLGDAIAGAKANISWFAAEA